MAKKISLMDRKRNTSTANKSVTQEKKDALMAMKLQELSSQVSKTGNLIELPIDKVMPDINQPRKTFKNIDSLASSIKENGIVQPIIVRPRKSDDIYYIIAGERRFLAAKSIGLQSIPCIIREEESDSNILLLQLLENDQRENVSPFEESDALKDLIDNKKVSKTEIAKTLGRESSWISMRLKISGANQDIRKLADKNIISDIRTLYELKKFSEESPAGAKDFIEKVLNDKVSGSFRTAINNYRNHWTKEGSVNVEKVLNPVIKVVEIKKEDNILKIKGKKGSKSQSYSFEMTEDFKRILFEALIK